MIELFKSFILRKKHRNQKLLNKIQLLDAKTNELEWAHIYHDSIRGKEPIEKLALNIGRWAGNYSFFYILNRILNDFRPDSILELGLGESSKFISTFINFYIPNCNHVIIEHDLDWIDDFKNKFELYPSSKIIHCPLVTYKVNDFDVMGYSDFKSISDKKFKFYLIDGPYGSERFSRFDIVSVAENIDTNDDFIILLDDVNRLGEQDTLNQIVDIFNKKNIKFYLSTYGGVKSSSILASKKFSLSKTF